MEFTPFIPLRVSLSVFCFARAVLAEIFGGFGRYVGEEFHFDSAEGFSWINCQNDYYQMLQLLSCDVASYANQADSNDMYAWREK